MTTTPEPAAATRQTIVVADDDADTLNIIKTKLESEGFTVVLARDGQEALQAVRKHKPALAILDVMMPRLNGFQVTRLLKFDKQFKTVPVILLTARAQQSDHDAGVQVRADQYITKPFDPNELLECVVNLVRKMITQQKQAM